MEEARKTARHYSRPRRRTRAIVDLAEHFNDSSLLRAFTAPAVSRLGNRSVCSGTSEHRDAFLYPTSVLDGTWHNFRLAFPVISLSPSLIIPHFAHNLATALDPFPNPSSAQLFCSLVYYRTLSNENTPTELFNAGGPTYF